jgi:N-acetylmuramoyl-L-alanine amidase
MTLCHRLFPERLLRAITIFRVMLVAMLIGGQPLAGLAAVIVLDPGHGGSDAGAGGETRFPEKRFTLALAEKIADRLGGRHRVHMTRTTDITVDPYDRAAVANQFEADLFVSLHAGVPPYCTDDRAFVFVHDDRHIAAPELPSVTSTASAADDTPTPWSRLQHRHITESRTLAEALARAMGRHDAFKAVTVAAAPLAALEGADRPAVLIEVGCIVTRAIPPTETIERQLDRYAQAIAEAIETALKELPR